MNHISFAFHLFICCITIRKYEIKGCLLFVLFFYVLLHGQKKDVSSLFWISCTEAFFYYYIFDNVCIMYKVFFSMVEGVSPVGYELPKYTVNFENTCCVTFYPALINHMCYLIGRIWLDYYICLYYYYKQMELQPATFNINSITTMDTRTYFRFGALYILIILNSASINDFIVTIYFYNFPTHQNSWKLCHIKLAPVSTILHTWTIRIRPWHTALLFITKLSLRIQKQVYRSNTQQIVENQRMGTFSTLQYVILKEKKWLTSICTRCLNRLSNSSSLENGCN